ncbi:hypothetical protein K7X08_005110 [Anisodus acutangulus]|uniref:Uncharacterized protein n=1 Tax=Anisodus acutangulus TaxID=402998 RepID=A0A9Q1RIU0_9SOLA|nr:hypothetical protein K7X08_005110 [Anisodus acutangulus]
MRKKKSLGRQGRGGVKGEEILNVKYSWGLNPEIYAALWDGNRVRYAKTLHSVKRTGSPPVTADNHSISVEDFSVGSEFMREE